MAILTHFYVVLHILCITVSFTFSHKSLLTNDGLENYLSPEDLREFQKIRNDATSTANPVNDHGYKGDTTKNSVPEEVNCYGFGSFMKWIVNMKPDSSHKINTHFYFSSRTIPRRVQVYPGAQFSLKSVDFKPTRKTVMIVHGFMSRSNYTWVNNMTTAFLQWADVNVIAVDWSDGGNTWKYWRAVANTRRVGSDIADFLRQLKAKTGARFKDFHFVGHSLGAHVSSYVSNHLGGVARITGLDPAQPCFRTVDASERLDETDADFVDVIHTNGRVLLKIGFGLPEPSGHADFYPNGGLKQPGCVDSTAWSIPFTNKVEEAICSHGRAYLLFTESMLNINCAFRAHRWNLTFDGVNASLAAGCNEPGSCAEMGIRAVGGAGAVRASGSYIVLTTDTEPYCPTEKETYHSRPDLVRDLLKGARLNRMAKPTAAPVVNPSDGVTKSPITTPSSWFSKWMWWYE